MGMIGRPSRFFTRAATLLDPACFHDHGPGVIIILNPVSIIRTPSCLRVILLLALANAPSTTLRAQIAPSPASAEVKQFQQLEDNWSIAFAKKDQYALELLLAPTFVNISAAGVVSTRNQTITEMFDNSTGNLVSMEQRAVTVRVLGDIALVDGTYVIHYRTGSHTVDERGVFTHVYQRARTSWICVHAQRTAVFDQTDEKAKPGAGKRSNAALPFHIPLVYKGAQPAQPPAQTPPDKQPPQ